MDEEVINDLYSRAKSKGYSKSREDFVKLLHNDSEVINDSYSYVKSKGYGKDINSFYNLIGKVETEPSTQKKKFVSDSSLEDGSSELPKSTKPLSDMPTLDQQGLESAMAKRQSVPTDMSGTPIVDTKAQKAAKPIIEKISKNKPELIKPKVLKEQEEKESYLENVGTNIMAGITDVDKMIASIPETIYGFFSMPQNAIAYMTGLDISTSADKFKKNVGITNPVLDYYKEEGKKLEKEITDFNKDRYESSSIYENIQNGNYGDAFELLGSGIARSAPTSIAMMAGGATMSTGELATAATTAFYNQNLEQIQEENPNASEIENNIKALGMAAAESVFSSIGEGQIGAVYKDIIKREGVEAGQKVFKDGLVQMYKGALEKYGVPVGLLGEGIEESATQITQNMISGKPAFDGAADAFILGGGSGVMFTAPISLKNAKDKIKNKFIEVDDKKKINTILADSNETFNKVFDVPKDSEINEKQLSIASLSKSRDLLVKDLKVSVKKGDITEDQAKQSLYVFDKTQQITGQLRGVDIDEKSKVKVANLLKERETLSDKITDKDPALSILEKQRIDEINKDIQDTILKSKETVSEYIIDDKKYTKEEFLNELKDKTQEELNTMKIVVNNDEQTSKEINEKFKENAVQEQSTTEIPVQSETGVSEEVEGRTPEAEPEVVTEQVTEEEVVQPEAVTEQVAEEEVKDFDLNLPENKDNIVVSESEDGFTLVDSETNNPIEVLNENAGQESIGLSKPYATEVEAQTRLEELKAEPEVLAEQVAEKTQAEVTAPQTIIEEQAPVEEVNVVEEAPVVETQQLNEQDLPGYDRTMSEVEGIVQKSKQRKVSESKIFDNVMSYVTGSKIYEDATDVQREALVRDVRKRFGLKEKAAPSVNKLFGKIKDVKKVTMTEKAALIKQIKDRIKGAKDVIKKQKEIASQIADEVKELRTKGKITVNQAANIISKFSKVNLLNETSVSNFVDYISKVFADAEYDNKINIAKGKLAKAKQNIVTKLGIADGLVLKLQKLFSINPTLIPEQSLNRYLELLDMFSARQQVLNLEEKSVVTKDVQDILDEINNEQSLSDELADRFEASESKVFKDDVLDYAASVKNMLKNGEIDEKEAELMTKYKDRIIEKEERAKMTEEEIEAEREILIKEIKKATVNPNGLPTRDEKELAKRFSRLIKGDAIKELTNTELKNVLKIIDNINNNYLPHYTQLMVEKINDINKSIKLENSVEKSKLPTFSSLYAKGKSLLTKKDAVLEMIRRNPLFYIDQVFGDFRTKDIFNSVLEMAAEGESNFTADFKKVKEKLDKAQNDVAKSFTFKDKLNPNKVLESSFKMMTYAVQLEYDSNVGNKEVNPAAEYLKATIKHINDGKSQFGERDAEVLQKILDDYSDSEGNIDSERLYNSFNNAEKNAIKTVREVNESLTEKAEYTAAIIRGQKINPLTNYIHLNVLHEHKPSDLTSGASFIDSYNNSIRPSTKAKSLIERTGKVSPLNFDIFSSAEKGAKFVLMDYNLTEPIRTARKTINRTISNLEKNGKMSKKNRQVINAINAAVEESIDNLLVNAYTSTSVVDDAVNYISKQGYRSVLAGTGRFVSEFLSNVGFIIISDPNTFTEGIKNMGVIMSADAPQIMQNVNSKETNRIFPSDMLSGRMIDTSVLNQASGVKGGTTKNAVLNRLEQFWNRTGKKYKNGVELTADFLISTPDKIIMRPIWFGSFANQFEKITGKKVDFKKIAENDEAYMEENREAIDQAKNIADERSVITGASSNAFTGILKGTVKPDQSTTVKAFNNFNNFMSKFLIYEYVTARTGIYAAMGNGSLTRKQGAALLGAVTTRMTVYSLLTKALGAGIIGLLFDDEEEEDKAIEKTAGQALASTFTSLILGRDFGNAPKTLINYGVERMNEEYLQALREGDYDPYKDSLQYTALPVSQKGKQISIDDLITRMSGSFGPAANTTNLILKKIYEPEKKEADAIERSEKEKNIRVPLEIAGNLGFVPLYKEIRQTVMKDIYEDLQNPMLRIERLKKTNPKLYERFKKLQAKSLDKEFQAKLEERRKRMEERLKKKIEERAKKD